jgi:hypothetical protein
MEKEEETEEDEEYEEEEEEEADEAETTEEKDEEEGVEDEEKGIEEVDDQREERLLTVEESEEELYDEDALLSVHVPNSSHENVHWELRHERGRTHLHMMSNSSPYHASQMQRSGICWEIVSVQSHERESKSHSMSSPVPWAPSGPNGSHEGSHEAHCEG